MSPVLEGGLSPAHCPLVRVFGMTAVNTAPGGGTTPLVAAELRGKIHDLAKNPDKPTHLLYLETTGSGGEVVTKTSNFLGWGAKVGIIGGVDVAYLLSSATEEYQDSGTHASMGSAGYDFGCLSWPQKPTSRLRRMVAGSKAGGLIPLPSGRRR